MKTKLELQVRNTIRRTRMMIPGDRVAVAVSGGADSVALFRLLGNLRDLLGITILIVHFDHCLRGAESDADAKFVQALASDHHVEFICQRADVAALAGKQRLNLEDAARRLRYSFFDRVAREGRATRVAVAHTADDQAETVLARLLRGTGPTGLAGISPVMGPIVRPLLAHGREGLRDYLRGLGQVWREDMTNADLSRQRAHIRAGLLPLLERDFSPRIVKHLGELARLSREEGEFWGALVEDRFSKLAHKVEGRFTIQVRDLLAPLSLQSGAQPASLNAIRPLTELPLGERSLTEHLIRRLYEGIHGDRRNLTSVHVEGVLQLAVAGASGRRVELPGGVIVQRNFGEIIFSTRPGVGFSRKGGGTKRARSAYHQTVNIPRHGTARISIPELATCFLLKVIDWPSPPSDTNRDNALDADLLPNTLTLRNWQPGDAYRPHGHRQSRKLKEMFLSRHISSSERASWPVIESAGRIVWVLGMPPAAEFCAGERTRLAVVIEEAQA